MQTIAACNEFKKRWAKETLFLFLGYFCLIFRLSSHSAVKMARKASQVEVMQSKLLKTRTDKNNLVWMVRGSKDISCHTYEGITAGLDRRSNAEIMEQSEVRFDAMNEQLTVCDGNRCQVFLENVFLLQVFIHFPITNHVLMSTISWNVAYLSLHILTHESLLSSVARKEEKHE